MRLEGCLVSCDFRMWIGDCIKLCNYCTENSAPFRVCKCFKTYPWSCMYKARGAVCVPNEVVYCTEYSVFYYTYMSRYPNSEYDKDKGSIVRRVEYLSHLSTLPAYTLYVRSIYSIAGRNCAYTLNTE